MRRTPCSMLMNLTGWALVPLRIIPSLRGWGSIECIDRTSPGETKSRFPRPEGRRRSPGLDRSGDWLRLAVSRVLQPR